MYESAPPEVGLTVSCAKTPAVVKSKVEKSSRFFIFLRFLKASLLGLAKLFSRFKFKNNILYISYNATKYVKISFIED